jgi:flagellar biosynthetic protein FlhB
VVALMFFGLASNIAQVGFSFSSKPFGFKLERMNPLNGIKKIIISRRSLTEIVKNLLKIGLIGIVVYYALQAAIGGALSIIDGGPSTILNFMGVEAKSIGYKICLAFFAIAAFDYFFQRNEHERDLRMTKQEVKEESKQLEGDPQIKGRIKTIQRQIAYRRMMQDVPTSDVVVTNPTHLAVALKYETQKMIAPKVVAKGADLLAARIRSIASEHNVPIVEDKPLAQTLYKSVDVGESIPEKLFHAVAQVLAHIYQLKRPRVAGRNR